MEAYLICRGDCDCIIATAFVSSYPYFAAADWNKAKPIVEVPEWPIATVGFPMPRCPVCGGAIYVRLARWLGAVGKHDA